LNRTLASPSKRYELTAFNPAPGLALAATYTREVTAGIQRIWENVLDWEHLPALHEIYFNLNPAVG